MLAWPSSSCTARRSPLDCSRWLAKEWRSMCGCTGVASPASWLRRRRRCQTDCAVSRVPWRPGNSAAASLPVRSATVAPRTASQRASACSASRPSGTLRRLPPLPSTWTSAASRSIQPRPPRSAPTLAFTSRPTSSPTRSPQPYSSSTIATSRASSQGSSGAWWWLASWTASSTPSALGSRRAARGARTSCTGLAATSASRPSQR